MITHQCSSAMTNEHCGVSVVAVQSMTTTHSEHLSQRRPGATHEHAPSSTRACRWRIQATVVHTRRRGQLKRHVIVVVFVSPYKHIIYRQTLLHLYTCSNRW